MSAEKLKPTIAVLGSMNSLVRASSKIGLSLRLIRSTNKTSESLES